MASFQAPIFNSKKFFVPAVSDEVDLAKQKVNQAVFDAKQAAGAKPQGADLYAVRSFPPCCVCGRALRARTQG